MVPHALGHLDVLHRRLELAALVAFDTPRHAAGTRIVRHQYQEAPGEADEGGQRGALVATLLLLDLHDDLETVADAVLDGRATVTVLRVALQELPRDLLERQETVALAAVIDEGRLEARLDARDARLVDVGLTLLPGLVLYVQIDELLPVDDRDPQLLLVSGVDQHSLHGVSGPCRTLPRPRREPLRTMPTRTSRSAGRGCGQRSA